MTLNLQTPPLAMISYSWAQADAAERLHEALAYRGFQVVHDRCSFTHGTAIPAAMADAVQRCDVFVPLLTPDSLYLDKPAGVPRPALDNEFIPAMRRRARNATRVSRLGSVALPIVIPVTSDLGVRADAVESVRRASGENIASLWSQFVGAAGDLTETQAEEVAAAALRSILTLTPTNETETQHLGLYSRGPSPGAHGLIIDAIMHLGGAERRVGSSLDWARVVRAITDVERLLATRPGRLVSVEIRAHLSAAFTLGRIFNQAARWELEVLARTGNIKTTDSAQAPLWETSFDQHELGGDLSVEIDLIGHDVFGMAQTLSRSQAPWLGRLQIRREDEGDLAPDELVGGARMVADEIRRLVTKLRPERLQFFCSSPVEFPLLLGHRLTAMQVPIVLHEPDDNRTYKTVLELPRTLP